MAAVSASRSASKLFGILRPSSAVVATHLFRSPTATAVSSPVDLFQLRKNRDDWQEHSPRELDLREFIHALKPQLPAGCSAVQVELATRKKQPLSDIEDDEDFSDDYGSGMDIEDFDDDDFVDDDDEDDDGDESDEEPEEFPPRRSRK